MNPPKPMLTEGPVGRHLVDMTVPVLFGITTMMTQSLIDTWFIGRVGDAELAAFGFGFPILMIVTSVAIGLGAGTSSVVARAIGAHDHRRARRLSTDSLLLSFLITAVIAAIGVLTITPLFRLLGAPDELMPLIRGFMTILYAGVPFVVVGMVGMASMRATGDTRLPSALMILASILNVILDPILIFGIGPIPAMGLNGAAMAALIARASIYTARRHSSSGYKRDRADRCRGDHGDDRALRCRRRCGFRCRQPARIDDAGDVLRAVSHHRPVRRAEFLGRQ
jgi:Na+-driven multidrug efflux pump